MRRLAYELLRGGLSTRGGVRHMRITAVRGREILDSRGRPTVEAELELADGKVVVASVPSGASTGRHEAVEARDGEPTRFRGRGVWSGCRGRRRDRRRPSRVPRSTWAVSTACSSSSTAPRTSRASERTRSSPSRWPAPAPRRRSQAYRSGATSRHEPLLPLPMVNIVSGGLHAGRQLDFQDFLVMPVGARAIGRRYEHGGRGVRGDADVLRARLRC